MINRTPHVCQPHFFLQFFISLFPSPPSRPFTFVHIHHIYSISHEPNSRAHKIIIQQTAYFEKKKTSENSSHRSHFVKLSCSQLPIVTHAKCDQLAFQSMLFVAFGSLLIKPCMRLVDFLGFFLHNSFGLLNVFCWFFVVVRTIFPKVKTWNSTSYRVDFCCDATAHFQKKNSQWNQWHQTWNAAGAPVSCETLLNLTMSLSIIRAFWIDMDWRRRLNVTFRMGSVRLQWRFIFKRVRYR